ncbi:MAG TPA: adenylate/guanylate cyclase domain-containing protein [Candidatus Methylomirabilis sp.]|nr:adenylate/guanylate cyclase domain-containing protein [Candidatus Methylomirabilis sp.]
MALTAGATPTPGSRFASPHAYTPKHLAERILNSRGTLEGERKQVTVLFADVKGSTELLADLDPEDARKLLDPVLERMMGAVHRYEGTVNRVLGDGIMAIFGAPLAHEDHAMRACCAALAMQQAIRRYTADARRTVGVEVQIRVGLNSGVVVVREVGNNLAMDYSAVGKTTHLAARMEQLASPGTIRLTPDTLRLVEGFVQVTSLGPVPVKGIADPLEVFELVGTTAARTRLQAAAARGLTRFVGRDAEINQLRRALEKAGSGRGQVVAVVGEPGVGKSRLFWEFVHSHRLQDWLVLESSSVSYGKATAYLPIIDLLKAYFRIEADDDERRIREKVTGKLLTLDEALRPTLPAFLSLLEVPVKDHALRDLDPERRRQTTLEALKRLLFKESQIQPLCIVFEDLHWIDAETQAVLDIVIDSLPTAQILLLVNYRPEYQHGWGSKTYYTQLRLDPLLPENAEELLRSLMGDDLGLAPLKRLLIDRTEGNPFFLEESVRTLVEVGVLSGDRGSYRPVKNLDTIQMPATVQAVLAARIDRLPPEDKTILQTAAVIGKDIPVRLLQAVTGSPEEALRAALTRLQVAEFLYETALFPEPEYTFKHSLTLEVAYASLLHERRRGLHARIVETFEKLYADRIAERVNWLAHHAFRGEVWGKALKYLRHAGSTSPVSLDAVLGPGPESPGHLWWMGDYERAIKVGQFDLAGAADFGNFAMSVYTTFRLGQTYHSLGDYPRAMELLRQNVAALEGDLLCEQCGMAGFPSVLSRSWLAWCLAERGEFAEGIALGNEGIQIAESANHIWSLIVACAGLGGVHLIKGDLDSAITVLERGLVLDRVENFPILFPFVASPLGFAYALSGRVTEAVPLLEQAVDEAVSLKLVANHPLRIARLGEAHLRAGRPDSALPLAERALELSREHKERGHEAYALRLLGEIWSRTDGSGTEKAIAHFEQARALAEELGMRPLMVRCDLGLSGLHQGARDQQKAQEILRAAIARAREMDMRLPNGTRDGTQA